RHERAARSRRVAPASRGCPRRLLRLQHNKSAGRRICLPGGRAPSIRSRRDIFARPRLPLTPLRPGEPIAGNVPVLQRSDEVGERPKAMRKQILFVQGGGEGGWQADAELVASLQRELGPDYEIRYPRMPNEDSPDAAAWKQQLAKELDSIGDRAILVGHSLGG